MKIQKILDKLSSVQTCCMCPEPKYYFECSDVNTRYYCYLCDKELIWELR